MPHGTGNTSGKTNYFSFPFLTKLVYSSTILLFYYKSHKDIHSFSPEGAVNCGGMKQHSSPSNSVAVTQPEETWLLFNHITVVVNQLALHRMQFMALNL